MQQLLKLFDSLTGRIPPNLLQILRLSALLFWLVAATIVAYYAWQRGAGAAPQMGQELSLSEIKERVQREENLHRQGDLAIPDLNELIPEERGYESPFEREPERALDLAGEDSRLMEPENPVNNPGGQGPLPFAGESNLSPGDVRGYVPDRDAGVGGVRDSVERDGDLLPLDDGRSSGVREPRRVPMERDREGADSRERMTPGGSGSSPAAERRAAEPAPAGRSRPADNAPLPLLP